MKKIQIVNIEQKFKNASFTINRRIKKTINNHHILYYNREKNF
jgi:hypothetical protein